MGLNPQQTKFKECYLDPSSPTFGNAYKSALAAEFEETYARTITGQGNEWFCEILRDKTMVEKAERNLNAFMELPVEDKDLGRMNLDATKFVAETLGKEKYSKKPKEDESDKQQNVIVVKFVSDKEIKIE